MWTMVCNIVCFHCHHCHHDLNLLSVSHVILLNSTYYPIVIRLLLLHLENIVLFMAIFKCPTLSTAIYVIDDKSSSQ